MIETSILKTCKHYCTFTLSREETTTGHGGSQRSGCLTTSTRDHSELAPLQLGAGRGLAYQRHIAHAHERRGTHLALTRLVDLHQVLLAVARLCRVNCLAHSGEWAELFRELAVSASDLETLGIVSTDVVTVAMSTAKRA